MTQEMAMPEALDCGCRPGFFLCPEAERLWADVGRAYDRRDFDEYDRALNAYNDHFGVPR